MPLTWFGSVELVHVGCTVACKLCGPLAGEGPEEFPNSKVTTALLQLGIYYPDAAPPRESLVPFQCLPRKIPGCATGPARLVLTLNVVGFFFPTNVQENYHLCLGRYNILPQCAKLLGVANAITSRQKLQISQHWCSRDGSCS